MGIVCNRVHDLDGDTSAESEVKYVKIIFYIEKLYCSL